MLLVLRGLVLLGLDEPQLRQGALAEGPYLWSEMHPFPGR